MTLVATVLMGYVNSYSYIFNGGSFVSPQTGNFVRMGAAIGGGVGAISGNDLALFGGFAAGCVLGGILIASNLKDKPAYDCILWSMIALPVVVLALFAEVVPPVVSVLVLSVLSGVCLALIRSIANVDVNNCIMTGNTKNAVVCFVRGVMGKDASLVRKALVYAFVIGVFFLGALMAGVLSPLGREMGILVACALCLVPYAAMLYARVKRQPGGYDRAAASRHDGGISVL